MVLHTIKKEKTHCQLNHDTPWIVSCISISETLKCKKMYVLKSVNWSISIIVLNSQTQFLQITGTLILPIQSKLSFLDFILFYLGKYSVNSGFSWRQARGTGCFLNFKGEYSLLPQSFAGFCTSAEMQLAPLRSLFPLSYPSHLPFCLPDLGHVAGHPQPLCASHHHSTLHPMLYLHVSAMVFTSSRAPWSQGAAELISRR